MPIRIITVEREYGSGGNVIAEKVASRLGWKLWDQLLTEEIARRLDCDCSAVEEHEERRDPAYYRLLKAFMRGSFEGSLNAPRLKMVDTECVREVVQRILPNIADAGDCVIVGRGSAYYLGGRPDAFHVFVYAPFRERVRRLQGTGVSEKEARDLAETVDRDRADFIKQYFDVDWPGRHRFHLMVNSGMGDEVAVEIILDAVAPADVHNLRRETKMKLRTTGVIVVSLSCLVILVRAAQDKYTVKVPGVLAFSEFRGYEAWQAISISRNEKVVAMTLGNPVMINAYQAGSPGNGKPVPDGAKMAKIHWIPKQNEFFPDATVPGRLLNVDFMVKDSKRFADSGGWGWAVFDYDAASDTFKPGTMAGMPPQGNDAKCGFACHTKVKARDYVFTDYGKR